MAQVISASSVVAYINATIQSVKVSLSENDFNCIILDAIIEFKASISKAMEKRCKAISGIESLT